MTDETFEQSELPGMPDPDEFVAARQLAQAFSNLFTAFETEHKKQVEFDTETAAIIENRQWLTLNEATEKYDEVWDPSYTVDDREENRRIPLGMARVNTGRQMMDSGMIGGRSWERNQRADLESRSDAWYEASADDNGELNLMVSIDVTHFLAQNMLYWPFMDRLWTEWADLHPDDAWYELIDPFALFLKRLGYHLTVREGERFKGEMIGDNTYNYENFLSQDFQYHSVEIRDYDEDNRMLTDEQEIELFERFEREMADRGFSWPDIDDMNLYLIQLHNGADIRGGYTRPVAFAANGYEGEYFDPTAASLVCPDCREGWWDTGYDGYHFTHDDSDGDVLNLQENSSYNRQSYFGRLTDMDKELRRLGPDLFVHPNDGKFYDKFAIEQTAYWALDADEVDPDDPDAIYEATEGRNPRIVWIKNEQIICPICNNAVLIATMREF